jgi:hypothetical protein
LVRDEAKAAQIRKALPGVKTIIGSLDDSETIKKAASEADIVVRKAALTI